MEYAVLVILRFTIYDLRILRDGCCDLGNQSGTKYGGCWGFWRCMYELVVRCSTVGSLGYCVKLPIWNRSNRGFCIHNSHKRHLGGRSSFTSDRKIHHFWC